MADTRVVLPARPCPIRARLRRLAPSYTFTGCLLPQAYGKGDKAPDEDEYKLQASPTTPAKLLMLTHGVWPRKGSRRDRSRGDGRPRRSSQGFAYQSVSQRAESAPLDGRGRPSLRGHWCESNADYNVAPFSAISFLIFSTNSPVAISSVFSFPRVRTLTLLASDS